MTSRLSIHTVDCLGKMACQDGKKQKKEENGVRSAVCQIGIADSYITAFGHIWFVWLYRE